MTQPIYQFYAELEDYKPKIWRRFQVAGNSTVARLGYIVMTMYEMRASHLLAIEHERPFLTATGRLSRRMELIRRYAIPDEAGEWKEFDDADATQTKLSQLDFEENSRLLVWYDFGDDWRVIVKLEKIFSDPALPAKELPRVLEGKGYGIVEDCGGIGGLEDLAAAFKAKQGDAYDEYREWLGVDELDLAHCDLDDMNFRLKKLPRIFADIYEKHLYPTQQSIDLIERKYLEKK
ncbi:MAG: plasmid pRiA4b ORF-3 family protein [Oscillospiraceae bacterium]|jgi:hypothetical protein|nr:plasmid pRiA4b ORF-3 family protein [Oscillospiraceae bacterium]